MSDYRYLKEVEVDNEVTPIGHYSIATWSSSNSATEHAFEIDLEDTSLTRGVMNITCVTQSQGCAMIAIPLNRSKPCSTYKVLHDDGVFDSVKYKVTASNDQKAIYKIKCKNSCMCNVSLQQLVGCKISNTSNGNQATMLIEKCKPLTILREGLDYGTTLPESNTDNVGRIFFKKV